MPLHYPRYTKRDYEKMEEGKLDLLLKQYGLCFTLKGKGHLLLACSYDLNNFEFTHHVFDEIPKKKKLLNFYEPNSALGLDCHFLCFYERFLVCCEWFFRIQYLTKTPAC